MNKLVVGVGVDIGQSLDKMQVPFRFTFPSGQKQPELQTAVQTGGSS